MSLVRVSQADLTVRGDGRTVYGYAVPFDVDAIVDDGYGPYVERFVRGAFKFVARQAGRVRFQYQHDDDLLAWIGNATLLREESLGLYGEFRVDNNERGKHALYKIADGQLPGLSLSFVPSNRDVHETMPDGQQRITRRLVKQLEHVAAVREPAYAAPEPLMVRHATSEKSSVERWRKWRAERTVDVARPT